MLFTIDPLTLTIKTDEKNLKYAESLKPGIDAAAKRAGKSDSFQIKIEAEKTTEMNSDKIKN